MHACSAFIAFVNLLHLSYHVSSSDCILEEENFSLLCPKHKVS